MGAGRPVRKRAYGFSNDISALNRLRTALKIDHSLDRNTVAKGIKALDALVEVLVDLDASKERKTA